MSDYCSYEIEIFKNLEIRLTMLDIPRSLIYQERYSLEDFGVYDKKGGCNRFLYKELLKRESPTGTVDRMEEILSIFNTTYYLVTLFLIDPYPETRVGGYCNAARHHNNYSPLVENQIIALFYFYLDRMESFGKLAHTIDDFTDLLYERMNVDARREVEALNKSCKGAKGVFVYPEIFAVRNVTDELLSSINWTSVTKGFSYRRIYFLTKNLFEGDAERCNMLDFIRKQLMEDVSIRTEVKEGKEQFINYLALSIVIKQELSGDEEEKILSVLKEKDESEEYRFNLEGKYTVLKTAYNEKEKEYNDGLVHNKELDENITVLKSKVEEQEKIIRDKDEYISRLESERIVAENYMDDEGCDSNRLDTAQLIILFETLLNVTLDASQTNLSALSKLIAKISGYKEGAVRTKINQKARGSYDNAKAKRDAAILVELLKPIDKVNVLRVVNRLKENFGL